MQPDKTKKRLGSILEAIGNTPLVRLNKLTRGLDSEVWVKAEFMNPSGSIKDRIALQILDQAVRDGKLKPGGLIVENTSGNTGAAIAMVSAVKGYRCIFTMPDKMSQEKVNGLKAYGARVVVTPTNVPADSPRSYYETAKRIHREAPGSFYVNQYHNPANSAAHYHSTAPEIWEQTDGKLDYYVAGMGTGGTFSGVAKYLKEMKPHVQCVGVDPMGSVFYEYWKSGQMGEIFVYKVEGIGEDMLVGNLDFSLVDDIIQVNDKQSFTVGRRLAREEGLFAGGSAGAAVYGALEIAKRAPKGSVIVAVLPDSGSRYLSKMYNDEWMRDNQMMAGESKLGFVHELLARRKPTKLVSVTKKDTVGDVIVKLKMYGISQLPVYENERLLGLIQETDLLSFIMSGIGSSHSEIETIMQTEFPRVTETAMLDEVSAVFTETEHQAVVVERPDGPTEILTKIDLIDYLTSRSASTNGGGKR